MAKIIEGFDARHAGADDLAHYMQVIEQTRKMMAPNREITPARGPLTMAQRGFHGFDGRNMTADEAARMAIIRRGRR